MNEIDLNNKVAVVTGGARGIGAAIVDRLLASGATLDVWDSDEELLQTISTRNSRDICTRLVDVSDASAVEAATRQAREHHGRIDILIANAGIAGPNHTTWEYPLDAWEKVIRVNLQGTFYCCRSVTPRMIEQNYGRIVTVASVAGKEGNPNASAYSASKAAVIGFTKSLGKELAAYNIAVNTITPAAARTRLFDQMSRAHIDYMLSKIPRERFVETKEIASLVAWLVSEENSFSTGAVFDLSGGRSTY
jgi:2-dehydro-3-deoxy-L-rhamnonate dehydrogenase (NAD+)